MSIVAFPLDNTEYTASAMGAFLGARTRGVFSAENNLSVSGNGNMTVTVSPGLAWLKAGEYWGLAVCVNAAVTLTVPTASGTLARLDAVCLRLDKTANQAELVIKAGAAAAQPQLPAPARDTQYDEIYLAGISVPAGAVSVTAADITDLRLDETVCGLMRDGVTGIPTAQLQSQTDALLEQLRQAIRNAGSLMGAKSVNGVLPDAAGNVTLQAANIDYTPANGTDTTVEGALDGLGEWKAAVTSGSQAVGRAASAGSADDAAKVGGCAASTLLRVSSFNSGAGTLYTVSG